MSLLLLPQSIISDIVVRCLYQAESHEGWHLRPVCSKPCPDLLPTLTVLDVFNDEVLFAYFVLKLHLPSLRSKGYYLPHVRSSFIVRSRLGSELATPSSHAPPWFANVRHALSILRLRTVSPTESSHQSPSHASSRFPLFQRTHSSTVSSDRASAAICGVIASYFAFREYDYETSGAYDSDSLVYLQRSPTFWLFAAACYTGDLDLLCDAFTAIKTTFQFVGIKEAPNSHNVQHGFQVRGESQLYPSEESPPGLSTSVGGGHAQMMSCLLEHGFKTNAVSLQDSTPLLAAVETRQVGVLKVLLDPLREWQRDYRNTRDVFVHQDRVHDNALRWKIIMFLTDNDSKTMPQKARDDIFYFASNINNVTLAKWAMSYGAIDMFGFTNDFGVSQTPLSSAAGGGYVDMLRLILASIETFVPATEFIRDKTYEHAYSLACKRSKLEAFMGLVELQRPMTPERAFVDAGMVDGASAMIENLMGAIDIQAVDRTFERVSSQGIGEKALHSALEMLRPQNLKFLLHRGCRLLEDVTLWLKCFAKELVESDPTLLHSVNDLLGEYGWTARVEGSRGRLIHVSRIPGSPNETLRCS